MKLSVERVKAFARSILYSNGVNTLPIKLIVPLFFVMLFNSMSTTMPFSFLPKLIKTFGYSEVDTGGKVGLIASSLFFGKLFSSFIWGMIADIYGRKRVALIAGFSTASSFLLFGFSYTFWWAFGTRLLQGATGGLPVVSRAILLEETDDTNRSLGISIIFGTVSLGYILGPSLGGFLAFPCDHYPEVFAKGSIFDKYPVLLPTSLVSIAMCIMLILFSFFIPGDGKKGISSNMVDADQQKNEKSENDLLLPRKEENLTVADQAQSEIKKPATKGSCWFSLLLIKKIFRSKGCLLVCLLNGCYSLVSVSYNEILPVYAATSPKYGGFGFSPSDIGLLFMIIAILCIVLQFTLYARIVDKLGLKQTFMICNVIQALLFPMLPTCHQIKNRKLFWAAVISVTFTIRSSISLAFVATNLLVNNSTDPSLFGSANGLCMTAGTLGRFIGVPIAGAIFSWSLGNGSSINGEQGSSGFPFNYYFTFFLLSLLTFISMGIAYLLPASLNHSQRRKGRETIP